MRSCKEVSLLVSESLDRELSLRERIGLKTHLMMCKACQRMARQMELISAVAQQPETSDAGPASEGLSKEARERIRERLREEEQRHDDHD